MEVVMYIFINIIYKMNLQSVCVCVCLILYIIYSMYFWSQTSWIIFLHIFHLKALKHNCIQINKQ